jgi:hypothetical protein
MAMSDKVFFVKDAGELKLGYNEMLIEEPKFLEEIAACSKFVSFNGVMGVNYLRVVAGEIGRKYDRAFSPYTHIVPSDYAGTVCLNDEEISNLIKRMFKSTYPKIFSSYIDTLLKNRPLTTNVVFCTMDKEKFLQVFQNNGIEEASLEGQDSSKSKKKK